jgi:predicted nucleotidyltransferase
MTRNLQVENKAQNIIDTTISSIVDTISHSIPTERIYLFGSYAYGTPQQDSDYDLFVVIPDGAMRPIEAMRKIHHALYPLNLKRPVDVLADYKSKFNELKQYATLEHTVDRQGVLLYERV